MSSDDQKAIAMSEIGDFVEERDGVFYLKEGVDPAHPAIEVLETNEDGVILFIKMRDLSPIQDSIVNPTNGNN